MRLTVMVTDFFYFFAVLMLFYFAKNFRFASSKANEDKAIFNVKTFGVCLFDAALLSIDNSSFQYNSLNFSLIILSTILLLQKRALLAALLYCIVILTKQISIYYSAAYFSYLLFHYVISQDNKL